MSTPDLIRDWTDTEIRWASVGPKHWRAIFNNIEVGGFCTEPSKHWDGIIVYFGNTKFAKNARDEAEARAWLTEKFRQWLDSANK